jgi:hypothetical protein
MVSIDVIECFAILHEALECFEFRGRTEVSAQRVRQSSIEQIFSKVDEVFNFASGVTENFSHGVNGLLGRKVVKT